jgi:hypothetical protein
MVVCTSSARLSKTKAYVSAQFISHQDDRLYVPFFFVLIRRG